jgi:hypothetical protein
MTFQTIPINITGGSYQSRSRPLSSQQTINWYQQVSEGGKDKFVLLPFPGLKQLGSHSSSEADRGITNMAEVLYQVKGTTLYEIDKLGNHIAKGQIPGTQKCIFANDGINLFIVSNLRVFQYDGSSVIEVTDPNITGAKSVDFLNNTFIYTKDKFTTFSNPGDGSTASGLNIIGAESSPDDLVRDYVFNQVLYRMGERTIESWYNSGVGSPPFDRIDGQIFQVGLLAIHSVANTDEAMYWLGDDFAIYLADGGTKQRVSTDAISNAIEKMENPSDAVASTFTFQGQNFYAISFVSGNKTFVLNESLGVNGWFELSSGTSDGIYQGSDIQGIYGKNIVSDRSNGKIYELDFNTYTNDGETLKRTRVTSSINGDLLGQKGKRVQMSRLELLVETGVGLINGQGDNPRIMIEASYDGGRTWAHGSWARTGRLGEFVLQVEWFNLRSFYDMILRITTSDPVNYSIYSGAIDLRLAGK